MRQENICLAERLIKKEENIWGCLATCVPSGILVVTVINALMESKREIH